MPGFGFGSRRRGRVGIGMGGGAPARLVLAPGALASASVRFPPENGEDPVSLATSLNGENGMLSLAGSNGSANLVANSSRWLQPAGALVLVTTLEPLIYDGLNRRPVLCGTNFQPSSRAFTLRYVPRSTGIDAGKEHRFLFDARGETGASAVSSSESAVIPDGVSRLLVAVRFDGTDFRVDMWDCETGTKVAGTPVAKPAGWDGISNLGHAVAVGGIRPDRFPLMASANSVQTINAWRGEIGLMAMLDTNPSDADLQAVALGAAPWTTFGTGTIRAGLLPEAAGPWPVQSNRAFFAGANWTQHGTVYPGSRIRRQSQASWFTLDKLPDPCLCTMAKGQSEAGLDVSFKLGGVSGQIQVQVQDEDGNILLPEWRNVVVASGATASGRISLPFHPSDKAWRLRFRVPDGLGGYLHAEANTDVVVCMGTVHMGQSEMVHGLTINVNVGGGAGNLTQEVYAGTTGGKHVYRCDFVTAGGGTRRAVIYRSRFNRFLGGGGQIALVNRLRQYTSRPLAIVNAAIAGASALSFINDADTSRRWSDYELALSALGNRDAAGRPVVRSLVLNWEAFWMNPSRTDWASQVLRPLANGLESLGYTPPSTALKIEQSEINHWLYDGVSVNPAFDLVVVPANRSPTSASATTDEHYIAGIRLDMRVNSQAQVPGAIIGPETAVQALQTNGG
ncbi:MAG TPA: hypothetical protein PKE25_12645, partial [Novosphingobium sp.]|nr:hypothetical protein [Novosphingobium sp.]